MHLFSVYLFITYSSRRNNDRPRYQVLIPRPCKISPYLEKRGFACLIKDFETRFWITWVVPKCHHKCLCRRQAEGDCRVEKMEERDKKPKNARNAAGDNRKAKVTDFPLQLWWRGEVGGVALPIPWLQSNETDFQLLVSITVRELISVNLSHWVCAHSLTAVTGHKCTYYG